MLMNELGRAFATTCPEPTISVSTATVMMYSMARVTTRLGTRPTAVMIPVTSPHASPTPRPTRNTTGIGIPWWAWNIFADTTAS